MGGGRMKIPSYFSAVRELVGGTFRGDSEGPVSEFVFESGQTPPTEEAIQAKLKLLKDEFDTQAYARSRKLEYPDLQECIHALLDGGDTLTELQTKRSEIKQKFPKPT